MATGLVDTNILIDLLRGYTPAQVWIRTQQTLGVARIVYMELIEGAFNKLEQQRALKLLKQFELIELVDADFRWATERLIKYQLSHSVGMMDCLIASTSHRLQLPLYTQNLKHMSPLLGALAQKPY